MGRPLIGISGNAYLLDDNYPVQTSGLHNIEAVSSICDGLPVIVPATPQFVDVNDLVKRFDAFVFTGARPNVHPEEYGEDETEAHGFFDRDRDRLCLPLIRACVDHGIPILGICRGFQEFNVAFGGSLYPEIRDLPGRDNHRMPPDGTLEEKFALRHDVNFAKGSVFEQIFGADIVKTNTLHGQGIKDAGERISVEGWAPDGTPEAIRVKDAAGFALAVQWHPEYCAAQDPVSVKLYTAFRDAIFDRYNAG